MIRMRRPGYGSVGCVFLLDGCDFNLLWLLLIQGEIGHLGIFLFFHFHSCGSHDVLKELNGSNQELFVVVLVEIEIDQCCFLGRKIFPIWWLFLDTERGAINKCDVMQSIIWPNFAWHRSFEIRKYVLL